jgi:hypothetical protein
MPRPDQLTVKRIVFFPGTPIATLDKPKPNLPPATFEFWNQLYLLARHHLIPREDLLALSKDERLKADPERLRRIALGLKRMAEEEAASREKLRAVMAEEDHVSLRGCLRYAKRLLARWFRRPSGTNDPAVPHDKPTAETSR